MNEQKPSDLRESDGLIEPDVTPITASAIPSIASTRSAYHCVCGAPIFFRNSRCLSCERELAYEPESASMQPLQEFSGIAGAFTLSHETHGRLYHRCNNFHTAAGCNWLVPLEHVHGEGLCIACSLNRTIPNQTEPENQRLWARIEAAKRRLVSQLLALGLPVRSREPSPWQDAQQGLAFDFLRDWPDQSITTGHADGVITVNAIEADDAERERIRTALHEPYRTLLGHLRHEVGHYYWQRLIAHEAQTPWLSPFRSLFGDEQKDYASALEQHYLQGAPSDWRERHVSPYASSHPWEDWAETWAHYLHMRDALDTAASFGLKADDVELRLQTYSASALWDAQRPGAEVFLGLINSWLRMTSVLNELSDSMGQNAFYPFALSATVVAKLQLVHEVIEGCQTGFRSQIG